MSRKSSRFSNPKNRRSKREVEFDRQVHAAKLEHHKDVLKKLGVEKVVS